MVYNLTEYMIVTNFGKRLSNLRKERNLTQVALAELAGCHVIMIRRYEANDAQPSLDIIRKLAIALNVSADTLVFEDTERNPDDDLKLQFEAISRMPDDEKRIVKALLEGMIVKYQTKQLVKGLSS